MKNKRIVLLMMGGKGERFGQQLPKQFYSINGMPLYLYILQKYNQMEEIDSIVIVTNPNYYNETIEWNKLVDSDKVSYVLKGGNGRSKDIKDALDVINTFADFEDVILIHDATHPYVDTKGTNEVIEAIEKYGGATLGGKQYDTVYYTENGMLKEVISRDNVVSGASPEGFKFGIIYDVYKNSTLEELNKMTSAGAIALANGIEMAIIPSNILNLKITHPDDMLILENLASNYYFNEQKKMKKH